MNYFLFLRSNCSASVIEAADLAAAEAAAALLAFEGERTMVRALAAVATVEEAHALFHDAVADEDYRDNYRAAFAGRATEWAAYEEAANAGCCGSADIAYLVAGRLYYIGCNYGH